jgi:4-carboxymuconolactone decarboxylase
MIEDIHEPFTAFKKEFHEICARHESLGKEIHENGGPLEDKIRWLIKIAISGACNHERALETHIQKAREAGATDEEIKHALLLLIPTAGFPTFMAAYATFRQAR